MSSGTTSRFVNYSIGLVDCYTPLALIKEVRFSGSTGPRERELVILKTIQTLEFQNWLYLL